jgi:two-component system, sensor histidine kinase and response regulator
MKKILVVEDAQALRKDIIEMLGYEGYQVFGADNGITGVESARQHSPDLIICDIMMPGMDGYGVLDTLRKEPATSTIPFIFLTARTERVDVRQGMELGADDYLTKPFTAIELLKSVQVRLEKDIIIKERAGKQMDALRNNMVLALPHELRTPLNVILGFSDLLMVDAEGLDAVRVADMGRYINGAALRLYRLIENYLIYAQIQITVTNPDQMHLLRSGTLNNAQAFISAAAQAWVQAPPPPSDSRTTDLVLDIQDANQVGIVEDYLKKIVEELVDNACKFSNPGTPIHVKAQVQGNRYVITVTDQGYGMTAEQIDMMGAYMQFDRRLREQQGAGLGLIIARNLTELHDGTFTVRSETGVGTQVEVNLPIRSA